MLINYFNLLLHNKKKKFENIIRGARAWMDTEELELGNFHDSYKLSVQVVSVCRNIH